MFAHVHESSEADVSLRRMLQNAFDRVADHTTPSLTPPPRQVPHPNFTPTPPSEHMQPVQGAHAAKMPAPTHAVPALSETDMLRLQLQQMQQHMQAQSLLLQQLTVNAQAPAGSVTPDGATDKPSAPAAAQTPKKTSAPKKAATPKARPSTQEISDSDKEDDNIVMMDGKAAASRLQLYPFAKTLNPLFKP